MTVVVLLQNERTNYLYFVSFPDGRVSTAVKQKQTNRPKQKAVTYINVFDYFEGSYPLGSQANYSQRG